MKRLILYIFIVVMSINLIACGSKDANDSGTKGNKENKSTQSIEKGENSSKLVADDDETKLESKDDETSLSDNVVSSDETSSISDESSKTNDSGTAGTTSTTTTENQTTSKNEESTTVKKEEATTVARPSVNISSGWKREWVAEYILMKYWEAKDMVYPGNDVFKDFYKWHESENRNCVIGPEGEDILERWNAIMEKYLPWTEESIPAMIQELENEWEYESNFDYTEYVGQYSIPYARTVFIYNGERSSCVPPTWPVYLEEGQYETEVESVNNIQSIEDIKEILRQELGLTEDEWERSQNDVEAAEAAKQYIENTKSWMQDNGEVTLVASNIVKVYYPSSGYMHYGDYSYVVFGDAAKTKWTNYDFNEDEWTGAQIITVEGYGREALVKIDEKCTKGGANYLWMEIYYDAESNTTTAYLCTW